MLLKTESWAEAGEKELPTSTSREFGCCTSVEQFSRRGGRFRTRVSRSFNWSRQQVAIGVWRWTHWWKKIHVDGNTEWQKSQLVNCRLLDKYKGSHKKSHSWNCRLSCLEDDNKHNPYKKACIQETHKVMTLIEIYLNWNMDNIGIQRLLVQNNQVVSQTMQSKEIPCSITQMMVFDSRGIQ